MVLADLYKQIIAFHDRDFIYMHRLYVEKWWKGLCVLERFQHVKV